MHFSDGKFWLLLQLQIWRRLKKKHIFNRLGSLKWTQEWLEKEMVDKLVKVRLF
jgi:hypothetical protein